MAKDKKKKYIGEVVVGFKVKHKTYSPGSKYETDSEMSFKYFKNNKKYIK